MDTTTLAPLLDPRGRGTPDPPDPAQVLAMPVVLRVERAEPPARSALLAAAAAAALALCLDDRCAPEGEWHEPVLAWTSTRIRKVTRRARGAHWRAAEELAGVTVDVGGAQARALVPGPVGALDPRVRRLQISGTELPDDEPGPPATGHPVLWCDAGLEMTVGKLAAQVGHASMLLGAALARTDPDRLAAWHDAGLPCAVRDAGGAHWRGLVADAAAGRAVAVRDAGYTEVPAGSTTVVATWP
ncbi:aminoacyl-tRNA hydrolase [Rhodococcus aerolatus]